MGTSRGGHSRSRSHGHKQSPRALLQHGQGRPEVRLLAGLCLNSQGFVVESRNAAQPALGAGADGGTGSWRGREALPVAAGRCRGTPQAARGRQPGMLPSRHWNSPQTDPVLPLSPCWEVTTVPHSSPC